MKSKVPVRTLCQIALFVALEIVLNEFCAIQTMGFKIGVYFIPVVLCAILFGPVWTAVMYGMADTLGAIIFPTGPYNPGFTLSAVLMGLCLGFFLYRYDKDGHRRKLKMLNNILPAILSACVIGLFLNTLWISLMYGSRTYWGWFMLRLTTQYALLVPVEIILTPAIIKFAELLEKNRLVDIRRPAYDTPASSGKP